jgi:tetratricopeptide (TPR) repeat protein
MLWRTELAARRTVLILDNAASTAQVNPLLPTGGMALTLITSRRRLVGLDGIHPQSIGVLAEDEATTLLAAIAGDRVGHEPEAAAEVVRRCGALPMAIRLAGARLAHRPRWRVADLARRLSESALPELAAEDRTVAGAFAVSYGQLTGPVQRTFRLLGRQPLQHFGVLSAAALTGMSVDDTQDQLDDLVDMHLVEEPAPGRYRLHDLLREFAGTLAAPTGERDAALSELVDFHLQVSTAIARSREHGVADGDFPGEPPRRPDLVAVAVDDPTWFDAQRPYLRALMVAAAELGEHRRAWQLARSSWRFLFLAAYNDDVIAVMKVGLEIAAGVGDERGIAVMRNYLASGYYRIGRYADSARQLTESLEYQIRIGNRSGEALIRGNLGGVLISMGRLTEAYALEERSYAIYRGLQNVAGLTARLVERADILLMLGRYDEALAMARRSLQCAVELRHPMAIAVALSYIGQARLRLGAVEPAARLLTAALRQARRVGYRVGEAEMINELGRVAVAQGRFTEAVQRHLAARQMVREQGARRAVAHFSNDLAVALRAMGDVPGALDLHRHALAMARNLAHSYEEGRALSGMAACLAVDDPVAARRHLRQALAIFTRMGVADRFDVERRLDGGAATDS